MKKFWAKRANRSNRANRANEPPLSAKGKAKRANTANGGVKHCRTSVQCRSILALQS